MILGRDGELTDLAAALTEPGLTVVAGGPGIGRTALAYAAAARTGRPVHPGGCLVTLRHVPYLPLSRAIRAPLPADDHPLAVEAVRARVGGGVLLLDDLQWADHATLDLLPELANVITVLATVRTPAPLTGPALDRLRATARHWIELPPLAEGTAKAVITDLAPTLAAHLADEIVLTAQGNPAVLTALTRAAVGSGPATPPSSIAALVAELPQDERTSLAALGLLGRPAAPTLLGRGAAGLRERGLTVDVDGLVAPAERIVAEVAAGVLPVDARAAMHRRLAELVGDDGEAARHLAAAGEPDAAAERAALAAERAGSIDARADYLALAAAQQPTDERRTAAARAALAAGRTEVAAGLVPENATLVRAEIALQQGDLAAARLLAAGTGSVTAIRAEPDPDQACGLAESALRRAPGDPDLLIAYGEALRRAGRPDWQQPLRQVLDGPDRAASLAAGAALVAGLREQLATAEAATLAGQLRERCAADAAYSWELNFTAELLWARLHRDGATEDVVAGGGRLVDHSMPGPAARLLAATVGLARGDGGALGAARAALPDDDRLAGWVGSEIAWLDGDTATAAARAEELLGTDLAGTLAAITDWWSTGKPVELAGLPEPAARALAAAQSGDFVAAARTWDGISLRERVRALLGADDPESLLLAERLADEAGLAVLLGRIRRALRRHGVVRRPTESSPAGLSPREYEVMALVAAGQSSRRIADRLGLTTNTVETYVRSAMGKLGARTRTEAAVRAGELAAHR